MFDVFLSYNSRDRDAVRILALKLRDKAVGPWLDEWELVPGEAWQKGLARGIAQSSSAAFLVGSSGTGAWEGAETMLVLNRSFRDPSYRVIPVLLPGAPDDAVEHLPEFANLFTWIDFRSGLDDANALHRFISGIRGVSPGPQGSAP